MPAPPQTARDGANAGADAAGAPLPHTHSGNMKSWRSGGRSMQKQKLQLTDEEVYMLPGSRHFMRGLQRAYKKGAYIPLMYMQPATSATPHRAGTSPDRAPRIGTTPLNKQPEW